MNKSLDNHYTEMGIEPIVYSDSNNLDPYQHTVVKYVTRWRAKGGLRDLKAAALILQKYINKEEALLEKPDGLHPNETVALNSILHQISLKTKVYKRIVTCGRGGMWAAAQLGYALGITDVVVLEHKYMTQYTDEDTLFVDDIADTGLTLQGIIVDSACLFVRHSTTVQPTYAGARLGHDEYIHLDKSQEYDKDNNAQNK